MLEDEWVSALDSQLSTVAQRRVDQVLSWLEINTSRFNTDRTTFQDVHRNFGTLAISLKASVQLCKSQCATCQLMCIKFWHHEGPHDCRTDHTCPKLCGYPEEHTLKAMQTSLVVYRA